MPDTLTHTAAKLSEHAQSDFGHYASMMGSVHEMIEAFWQRVPYLLLALLLFIVFWLFAKISKNWPYACFQRGWPTDSTCFWCCSASAAR